MNNNQKENKKATKIIAAVSSNPIESFQLIKRLTFDWNEFEDRLLEYTDSDILKNLTSYKSTITFPNKEDLKGTAMAIARLQIMYNLKTDDLAKGMINGTQYQTKMSADDCFDLGQQLHLDTDHNYHLLIVSWLLEADKIRESHPEIAVKYSNLKFLNYLFESLYEQGNYKAALFMLDRLLQLDPQNSEALNQKMVLEHFLIKGTHIYFNNLPLELPNHDIYDRLCRKQLHRSSKLMASLRYKLEFGKEAFRKLNPFKLEEVSFDPYIVLYHDILSDYEIEIIKNMAQSRRSVINSGAGVTNIRISNSAWIMDDDHLSIRDITARIGDMTGLNMHTAEDLQVANYGIGGYYAPHFDYLSERQAHLLGDNGNRIATVIFYLSDVEQGGATVFPSIDVALWPQKGSAAFWYNLYASGERDPRSLHSACPVLVGNKWVSNKWLRESGQELIRPCKLYPDHLFNE